MYNYLYMNNLLEIYLYSNYFSRRDNNLHRHKSFQYIQNILLVQLKIKFIFQFPCKNLDFKTRYMFVDLTLNAFLLDKLVRVLANERFHWLIPYYIQSC